MSDGSELILPVVAHRILGTDYVPDPILRARMPVYEEDRVWVAWRSSRLPPRPASLRKARRSASAEVAEEAIEEAVRPAYVTPGTRRTIDHIRDLFDGGHRAAETGDANINDIWAGAGLRFRLVAIIDHAIRWYLASATDSDLVKGMARALNTPDVVNLYFFRTLIGGIGTGGFSPVPLQSTRWKIAFAAVEDWEEYTGDDVRGWNVLVRTAAHELGHLLNLRHHEDSGNLMYPWLSDVAAALRPLQIMVAHEHARLYLPALERLCLADAAFGERLADPHRAPLFKRAYMGERLRFGGHRG
jgi:hypothetical protein